jgi:hypothetical protein
MAKGEGHSALLLAGFIVFFIMCNTGIGPTLGHGTCVSLPCLCEIGSYLVNGGCELCQHGSYSSSAQATTCNLCSAGKYSSEAGTSSCELCEPGTFSSNFSMSSGEQFDVFFPENCLVITFLVCRSWIHPLFLTRNRVVEMNLRP